MKFRFIILLLIAIAGCFAACKKFVDIEPAPELINSEKVFANDATALSAMNGIYIKLRSFSLSLTNGGLSIYTGLSADEIYNTASSSLYDPFFKDSIPVDNNTIHRNFWTESYANIYKVNAVLEGLQQSTLLTDSVKTGLLGEAKFIRSLYYFYLVNLFGDVPLVTSTDYELNQSMPRSPVAQVYQQITTDLEEAERQLPTAYPSAGKVRVNRWAATALLARVYLYQKAWQRAEEKASAVIGSGLYTLVANPANVFVKNSSETILEIAPQNESGNTAEGANFIPSSATVRPPFALTNSLLNRFAAGDQRKASWTKVNLVGGIPYHYPFKYKVKSSPSVTEYNILLRLAEQYMIRAEARTYHGNLSGAVSDLNVVRSRASLPATNASTQPTILQVIEEERAVELFSEWGHRWLDLKRTGRIDQVLGAIKPSWRSTAALYPIPFAQLQLNVFLTQNPGY
ncbi:MAG TPA: RagB/SusD family nutrient uptake outer membrane protein [Flavisolibacter sp.]|nr:RagB/SusD family nutrient uptake outer membrane protein [Flavisolibacter sp.]